MRIGDERLFKIFIDRGAALLIAPFDF